MDINELLFQNIPPQLRGEYIKCPHCGSIVNKQNYCPVCDSYIGDVAGNV